uniref:Sorting nexin 25 n=1 Tax=Pavo cristatus TaxID=9049 RepID=A0A8C9G4M4_PAVCR
MILLFIVVLFLSVFDYIYRDYILSWYGQLSRDEGQLYQLLSEDFWEIAKQLRLRLSHIDVVKVVCNDVVKALLTHFCDLKGANARKVMAKGNRVKKKMKYLQTCYHRIIELLVRQIRFLSFCLVLKELCRIRIIAEKTPRKCSYSKGKETAAMKADLLRARNMKRYINQLTVAKKQCEKRIRFLGGPAYDQQEDGFSDEGDGSQSCVCCETLKTKIWPNFSIYQGCGEATEECSTRINEQASYAVNKLRQLNDKLKYKKQALNSICNSPKPNKKIVSKLKDEITLMEREHNDLQLHIARTDWWCENLGMWKAFIISGEVLEENGEQVPCYSVLVSLQEVGGAETKNWTVPRKLSEFQNLHRKLSECFPSLKKVQLPSLSKLPFKSIDQKFMEKSKNQLNNFLQKLLSDERLCQSEALYAFLSPSPEHLKVIDVQGKKSSFSLSSFLERLPCDWFSHQEEETEEDSDLSDYGEEVDGKKDSIAEPCFMLIGEIFELRGSKLKVKRNANLASVFILVFSVFQVLLELLLTELCPELRAHLEQLNAT